MLGIRHCDRFGACPLQAEAGPTPLAPAYTGFRQFNLLLHKLTIDTVYAESYTAKTSPGATRGRGMWGEGLGGSLGEVEGDPWLDALDTLVGLRGRALGGAFGGALGGGGGRRVG